MAGAGAAAESWTARSGNLGVARVHLLDRLVQPDALVHVPVRVVVLVVERLGHLVWVGAVVPERIVRPLEVLEVLNDLAQDASSCPRTKSLCNFASLLKDRVHSFTVDLTEFVLLGVLVPLVADGVESPEIDWPPAHRAATARPLQVPALYAASAELVRAGQLAEGARLAVAHRTLAITGHLTSRLEKFLVALNPEILDPAMHTTRFLTRPKD